jgi:phosphatidylglycerophosphate synthase
VTAASLVLVFAVLWWFSQGAWLPGLLAAWVMTFLDTVDGKLARVTATSSKLGDRLDHITDIIHPPIWWAALAYGLAGQADAVQRPLVWGSCLIILVGYFVGRTIETAFKTRFRYNCYMWRPFDSAFRLVVSRRNIILLIMTAGLILGVPIAAFVAAAAWTLISGVIQVVRLAQAYRAGQDGSLPSWLM